MHFNLCTLVSLLVIPVCSLAQKEIDIPSFDERLELVKWMVDYTDIAGLTTDSINATPKKDQDKLGNEWFCIKRDSTDRVTGLWDAIYGKFENGRYNMAFHYTANIYGTVKREYTIPDTALLNCYGRTVMNCYKLLPDSIGLPLHVFVKRNADKTFSVWMMPGYNKYTKMVIYGCDLYFHFDNSGSILLDQQVNIQPQIRSFPTDRPKAIVPLDCKNFDEPPIGAIYFGWKYKNLFKNIYILTKKSTSFVYRDAVYTWSWAHYERHD